MVSSLSELVEVKQTGFRLLINLEIASAGIDVPAALITRVDEVIE